MNYPLPDAPNPTTIKLSIRKNREMNRQFDAQLPAKSMAQLYSSRKLPNRPSLDGSKVLRYPPNYLPDRYLFE